MINGFLMGFLIQNEMRNRPQAAKQINDEEISQSDRRLRVQITEVEHEPSN